MGPLFSAATIVLAISATVCVAFVIARFFYAPQLAIRVATYFVVGGVWGTAGAFAILVMIVGIGGTLVSSLQVVAYLLALASGGLVGSIFSVRWYLRTSAPNDSLKSAAAKSRTLAER